MTRGRVLTPADELKDVTPEELRFARTVIGLLERATPTMWRGWVAQSVAGDKAAATLLLLDAAYKAVYSDLELAAALRAGVPPAQGPALCRPDELAAWRSREC